MVFANLFFIYLFLPLNLVFYFASKKIAYRNAVLVIFSFVFYAWGEPVWVALLITSAMFDYMNGRLIERYRGTWIARGVLAFSLLFNLSILSVFKYSGFLIENMNVVFNTGFSVPSFTLPIGISFYTFQTISYVLDVYRGHTKAQGNPMYYLLYLSMYHQLVAGPVVRYADVAREICVRETTWASFSEGMNRFVVGLVKKVLIANTAGQLATNYLEGDLASLSMLGAWFGAILFTFQIYYDFSGYSDMAIGLGRMFGFHYRENFNYPYISKSVGEFWRRWHISLGNFFRDYVYIPLGGNRNHVYFNLLVVWLLTGLWHGASWNFVLWGLYFGLFIVLERKVYGQRLAKLPAAIQHLYLLLIVVFGWMLFYFTNLGRLGQYLKIMLGVSGNRLWDEQLLLVIMNNVFWILLATAFCLPVVRIVKRFISERLSAINICAAIAVQIPLNVILLIACTAQLVGQSYNPFLYYRF